MRVVDERHFAKSSENADPVGEKVLWYRFRTVSENRLIYVNPIILDGFRACLRVRPKYGLSLFIVFWKHRCHLDRISQ